MTTTTIPSMTEKMSAAAMATDRQEALLQLLCWAADEKAPAATLAYWAAEFCAAWGTAPGSERLRQDIRALQARGLL